jgi:hypothetical protein
MNLSEQNQKRADVWINHFKVTSDFTPWIKKNHSKVFKYIEEKYENLNTKSAHLSTLAVIVKQLFTDRNRSYKKYTKQAKDYKIEHKTQVSTNQLSGSRLIHQVEFKTIQQKRDQLKYKVKYIEHMRYLILCLYTYQPPIRSEWADMRIFYNSSRSKKINYLNIKKDKILLHINKDKVATSHDPSILELSPVLTSIIKTSLQLYPRSYVLTNKNTKAPMKYQSLRQNLHAIFDKMVGIDIIRSAYVTNFYKSNPNYNEKIQLAKDMRSSVELQQSTYLKIRKNTDPDVNDYEPIERNNVKSVLTDVDVNASAKVNTSTTDHEGFDLKKWSKKYREKNKTKINDYSNSYYKQNKFMINKKKLLRNMQVGNVSKPTEASIKKYNLKLVDGVWS